MFRINCEYDIGQDDLVFQTEEVAYKHARNMLEGCGIEDTVEELEANGLFNLEPVEVR